MPQPVPILFGALFTASVATALGRLLFKALSLRFCRIEEWLLAFVAGSACLSVGVFGLALVHLARWEAFLVLGLLVLGLAVYFGVYRSSPERLAPLSRVWRDTVFVGLAVFCVLYLVNAMAPEISPDGSGYHLGLVSRYLRHHGIPKIITNMYANLSQGVEMLFLFAFAFGRHSAAALVHFCFTLALPLIMLCYGRRFGIPTAGAIGALFVFASPVVGIDGTSAYNDVAVATVLFTLHYLLQIWDRERADRLLIPIGLVAGFGYAIKYTAFLGIPYALGFVAWRLLRERRRLVRSLAVVSACAILMMSPWLLKNWIWLGNPFSPFLNGLFPNPYIHVGMEEEYRRTLAHFPVQSLWEVPLELTVRGGVLNGLFGPLFLLAPLALLTLRKKIGRQLLLATLVFALTYPANFGTRFLMPCLPFLSLALGLAVSGWGRLAEVLVLAHLIICSPDVVNTYDKPWAWTLKEIPWRAALRIEPEESFLRAKLPYYGLARLLEEKVPEQSKVFGEMAPPEAHTSREVLVGYQSALGNTLRDIVWTAVFPGLQPIWRLSFPFPSRPLRKIRVVQEAADAKQDWSVSELRIFEGSRELPRISSWRFHSRPNPWEAPLAFDGNPATRWLSWQHLFPGMYVEVDFGKAETADLVQLDCSPEQGAIRLKLMGETEQGTWVQLAAKPRSAAIPPPPGVERLATQALKTLGIDYMLVLDSNAEAKPLKADPGRWGVSLVAREGTGALYRILPAQ